MDPTTWMLTISKWCHVSLPALEVDVDSVRMSINACLDKKPDFSAQCFDGSR